MNFNTVAFEKKLRQMSRSGKKKDIHAFRVDYKRHRALFDVINMQSDKQEKLPPVVRKIYHRAGEIRERQLEKRNLKEYLSAQKNKLHCYQKLIRKKINKNKRRLQSFLQRHEDMTCEWKKMDWAWKQVSVADIEVYIVNRIKKIGALRNTDAFSNKNLHAIRKILKNIWYALSYLEDIVYENSNNQSFEQRYRNTSLFKLMNDLGSLHDLVIAVEVLKRDIKKEALSKNTKSRLSGILKYQKCKKKEMENSCIEQLTDLSLPEIEQLMMRSL